MPNKIFLLSLVSKSKICNRAILFISNYKLHINKYMQFFNLTEIFYFLLQIILLFDKNYHIRIIISGILY